MRVEDVRASEICTRQGEWGFPLFASSRNMLMGTRSLSLIQDDLVHALGSEKAAKILARHGYEAGMATATAMEGLYDWESREELLKAGSVIAGIVGLAMIDLERLVLETEGPSPRVVCLWRNSMEATTWVRGHGLSRHPVCHILAGCISGYLTACLGMEMVACETGCKAQKNNDLCSFEARPVGDWGLKPGQMRRFPAGISLEEEVSSLRSQLEDAWKEVERRKAQVEFLSSSHPLKSDGFVFRSQAMEKVASLAGKVATSDSTVLIMGPSGTGKEILAHYIHRCSGREKEPFMAINCAALPPNLLESELFGHVKGAFTGADRDRKGLFVEARHGTLFLDEVGELPFQSQAKLLRALQERQVRPVGGAQEVPVHARIIAASNVDLQEMLSLGRFRTDLYYRLAVIPIQIPPLANRQTDILPLARYFLEKLQPGHPGFSPEVVRKLVAYPWPGNARELKNTVEYALALAGCDRIQSEHLPAALLPGLEDHLIELTQDLPTREDLMKRYMRMVIEYTGGNKKRAAAILGVHPSTLWRQLKDE